MCCPAFRMISACSVLFFDAPTTSASPVRHALNARASRVCARRAAPRRPQAGYGYPSKPYVRHLHDTPQVHSRIPRPLRLRSAPLRPLPGQRRRAQDPRMIPQFRQDDRHRTPARIPKNMFVDMRLHAIQKMFGGVRPSSSKYNDFRSIHVRHADQKPPQGRRPAIQHVQAQGVLLLRPANDRLEIDGMGILEIYVVQRRRQTRAEARLAPSWPGSPPRTRYSPCHAPRNAAPVAMRILNNMACLGAEHEVRIAQHLAVEHHARPYAGPQRNRNDPFAALRQPVAGFRKNCTGGRRCPQPPERRWPPSGAAQWEILRPSACRAAARPEFRIDGAGESQSDRGGPPPKGRRNPIRLVRHGLQNAFRRQRKPRRLHARLQQVPGRRHGPALDAGPAHVKSYDVVLRHAPSCRRTYAQGSCGTPRRNGPAAPRRTHSPQTDGSGAPPGARPWPEAAPPPPRAAY